MRKWLLLALCLGIAISAFRLEVQALLSAYSAESGSKQVFIHMHNATQVQFNQAGQLQSRLTVKQIKHQFHHRQTELQQPLYRFYKQGQTTNWIISAAKGRYDHISNQLFLRDEIEIITNEDLLIHTMKTTALTIDQDQASLSSDAQVQFIGDHLTIEGQGLSGHLHEETIQIPQQVKGIYANP